MKKLFFVTFILTYTLSYSQYGWMVRSGGVDPSALVTGISFSDAANGMLVTSNFSGYKVYRTTNGGVNWNGQSIPTTSGMWAVKCFSPLNAIICGATGYLFRTTNGGTNWVQINVGGTFFLTALCFIDMNTGWVSGGPLKIMKTTNNGINWVSQYQYSTYTFSSIHMANANTGFAADYFQNIVKTTDGGNNWVNVAGPSGYDELWGTCMTDPNTVYCCGENAKVIKSTNQGVTWTVYQTFLNRNLYAIHFLNPSTGYSVGDSSLIIKTSNAGANWSVLSAPVTENSSASPLTCISFVNELTGFVAGHDGTILFTTTGGLTPVQNISSGIPRDFSFDQNYPNPFNPITKLKFQMSKSEFAYLRVFDVTGKEIITLVNEELKPGIYEIDWDASNYPSGVYFCRLNSKHFSKTIKMTLVK